MYIPTNQKIYSYYHKKPVAFSFGCFIYYLLFINNISLKLKLLLREVIMKVKPNYILKSHDNQFDVFEENQIIQHSGNLLCVKEFGEPTPLHFITLTKELVKLYSFKPGINKKHVYTAEQISNRVEIAQYNFKGERKSYHLSQLSSLGSPETIEKIELMFDQLNYHLVFGAAKTKNDSCIFLIDFMKLKLLAIGFKGSYEDIQCNSFETMVLSTCGKGFLRNYKVKDGIWELEEKNLKKLPNPNLIKHEYLTAFRLLLCSPNHVYLIEDNELLQTITYCDSFQFEIQRFLKVSKGFLLVTSEKKILNYTEESEDLGYSFKQEVKFDFENESVDSVQFSANCEDVYLQAKSGEMFIWRRDVTDEESDAVFTKVRSSYTSAEEIKSISASATKRLCIIAGTKTVALWDLKKNQPGVVTSFSSYSDENKDVIYSCAINPDGNSFVLSFTDRLRSYRILMSAFKLSSSYPVKKCKTLTYSHGGQYIACSFGKATNSTITVLNSLRWIEVYTIKVYAEPLDIIWAHNDDELIVATTTNLIHSYRISQNQKISTIELKEDINYLRFDYKIKKLLISTDKEIYIADNGDILQKITPKISNFSYIFPLHGSYFIADIEGTLYWSNSLNFDNYSEIPLFTNEKFSLLYRNGSIIATSQSGDMTVLSCDRFSQENKLYPAEDIVFVEKSQTQKMFNTFRNLEGNFEILQNSTQIKLEEEKKMYEAALQSNINKFQNEIDFLNKKFHELQTEKSRQEKDSERIFQTLEKGQFNNVSQLQRMYDKKLSIEKDKGMNLEQQCLEQKMHSEEIIENLQLKYHNDVAKIRIEYDQKLKKEYKRLDDLKTKELEYKKKMELKLINLQEENELTLHDLQMTKDQQQEKIQDKYINLERQHDNLQVNILNKDDEIELMHQNGQRNSEELKKALKKLQENMNLVKKLEQEVSKKDRMIEQRNTKIDQQNYQINSLQKAKNVLSFRTTQIRKELEPKENLIEKLKSELFKLDEQFKQENKHNYELSQKVEKLEHMNDALKKENSDKKLQLQIKQKLYDGLCYELFIIVTTVDAKEWNNELVKVYQQYVKQDSFKTRLEKKKDNTSDEINRHLIHVEQSLIQISSGNDKILKGKEKDVIRKMKENAELVYDLNVMRKKQNQYLNQLKEKANQIARLKRELQQSNKLSTRAHTAKTGLTRRVVQSREKEHNTQDLSDFNLGFPKQPEMFFGDKRSSHRNRISSAHKTVMWRQDKQEKSKIFGMAKDLETARDVIRRQDRMIEELNQRLLGMPDIQ